MTAKEFNIGDLVAYDDNFPDGERAARGWGIIIKFDNLSGFPRRRSVGVKVRWSKGWTDWYNTDYLIMIEKAKQ
jgi:hypothetical protein